MKEVFLLLIEQLNSSVLTLIVILISLFVLLWRGGRFYGEWKERQNSHTSSIYKLQEKWDRDIPFIKERVNLLYTTIFSDTAYKNESPAKLTDIGNEISVHLKAGKILENNLDRLKGLVEESKPITPYDLQQVCFSVVEDNMTQLLSNDELNIAKDESVKRGMPLDHTLSIFAILLRDKLLEEKGWNISNVDKKK